MTKKQKDYYTTREAAGLLGVAVSTVQLWTDNGSLRAWITNGGHRRIARDSVDAMHSMQQVVASKSQALKVVVVEDNAQQLRMYVQQFKSAQLNTEVTTASDGFDGSIKIGRILPDVIIADLQMPNLDGFQMIRALKDIPDLAHSLIIVVTGLTEDEIKARGGLPDGVHFFTKPVSFAHIEQLINQHAQNNTPLQGETCEAM